MKLINLLKMEFLNEYQDTHRINSKTKLINFSYKILIEIPKKKGEEAALKAQPPAQVPPVVPPTEPPLPAAGQVQPLQPPLAAPLPSAGEEPEPFAPPQPDYPMESTNTRRNIHSLNELSNSSSLSKKEKEKDENKDENKDEENELKIKANGMVGGIKSEEIKDLIQIAELIKSKKIIPSPEKEKVVVELLRLFSLPGEEGSAVTTDIIGEDGGIHMEFTCTSQKDSLSVGLIIEKIKDIKLVQFTLKTKDAYKEQSFHLSRLSAINMYTSQIDSYINGI